MLDKKRLFEAAKRAGVDIVPVIYDKDGRRVRVRYGDGTYSYVDPTFDLSYYDEKKRKSNDSKKG